MTTPQVIIRGRCERKEFAEPFRQCTEMLEKIGADYRVNPAKTDEPVDFMLFFQSYPHEFLPSDLGRLRRNNPFAPFFYVLGVCCEGMLRTAGPLDSPFYRYVHGWNGTEPEEIRRFLTEQPSLFALPMTVENDEIALWENSVEFTLPHPNPLPEGEGTVKKCLILTHCGPFGNDFAMNRLLADEQERLGYKSVFSGKMLPDAFTGKILADADDSPMEKILKTIQRLRRQFADNDFTVYVDSPRFDEKNDYIQAGVTRVLPKIR